MKKRTHAFNSLEDKVLDLEKRMTDVTVNQDSMGKEIQQLGDRQLVTETRVEGIQEELRSMKHVQDALLDEIKDRDAKVDAMFVELSKRDGFLPRAKIALLLALCLWVIVFVFIK